MKVTGSSYNQNIFINCPFDDNYWPMLQAAIFCIFDCRFVPRSALEKSDSGQSRIEKIYDIIKVSKYGVHDISRTELDDNNSLPRFNMPFELGIFLGAKKYGDKSQREKLCLILDSERYRFQKFLSDIAGQDIKSHNNKPDNIIRAIRNWLNTIPGKSILPGSTKIFSRYKRFIDEIPRICAVLNLNEDDLTYTDYCAVVSSWLEENSY
jgi:hypothetical protein